MTFGTISGLACIFWISLRTTFIAMSIGKSFFESFRTDNSLRHPALSFFRFWSFAFSHCIGEKLLFGSIEGIIFHMRVDLFGLNSLLFWGYNFYFDNCLLITNMNVSFDRISHFFIEVGDTFDWPLRLVPTWKLRWVSESDICIFSWAMSFGIRGCVIDLFFVSPDKCWLWGQQMLHRALFWAWSRTIGEGALMKGELVHLFDYFIWSVNLFIRLINFKYH